MKTIDVRLEGSDCDALQSRQIETEGLKELYYSAMGSAYNIPEERLTSLEARYLEKFAEYNILKDHIQTKYMPQPNALSWNVTFANKTITFFYE